jgi:DNA-binding MarR family transcriptional regulator
MADRKQKLVARLGDQVRRMGAQSVLISKTVAARFGLNTSDLECLDLIYLRGHASAGELARATGLTSGAVTALIDRLERAGYVERIDDPTDRRRREVRIMAEAIEPIQAVYQPMQMRMLKLWSSYSARDLAVILDFVSRSTDLSVECTEAIAGSSATRVTRLAHALPPARLPARARRPRHARALPPGGTSPPRFPGLRALGTTHPAGERPPPAP